MTLYNRDVADIHILNCGASASILTSASASGIISADVHADADEEQVATRNNFEKATRELSKAYAIISSIILIIQMLGKNLI